MLRRDRRPGKLLAFGPSQLGASWPQLDLTPGRRVVLGLGQLLTNKIYIYSQRLDRLVPK